MKVTDSTLQIPNTIVQASAGSGKTFALSNRFLQLVAAGVPCDTILATTFTRKAAGEILDRVMLRLTNAAEDATECEKLSKQIGFPLKKADVVRILRHLTENFHRLQIATLDSFFHRIARSYSFELGLPVDWQVVEGGRIQALSEVAVRNLLHDANTRQFLHLITKNNADRKIADMMITEVGNFFEIYRDSTPAAWKHGSPGLRNVQENLLSVLAKHEPLQTTNRSAQSALEKDCDAIRVGDYEQLIDKSLLFERVLEDNLVFNRKEIEPQIASFYKELVSVCKAFITTIYADRTLSAWRLVDGFANQLWPMQMEVAQLRFADVTFALQKLMHEKSLDFEFRLDQEVRHLLLDEFQDTSPGQWQILEPIARRLFEKDRNGTFFCVGDQKQAIFAWRGGVAEIFDVVQSSLGEHLEPAETLSKSHRSSPVIIEAVNCVFKNLSLSRIDKELDREVLINWQSKFPEHQTEKTELPGYVAVDLVHADKQTDEKSAMYQATVDSIDRLFRQNPSTSIGVLVGSHADIAEILFLLHQRQIPASEEGGNSLNDSAAVNLILSALHLADHPGDSIARFHLSHSPLALGLGFVPEDGTNQTANAKAAEAAALILRRELLNTSYGKTIERLAGILDPFCTARERRRLDQLIELAFDYDEPWTLRTSHFVERIKTVQVLEPSAARVRVMTIHAAKGLEFDAVVAPFFGPKGQWKQGQSSVVYSRSSAAEPIDLVHLYAGDHDRRLLPVRIQNAFDDYRRQEIRERLCLLYVLMTRAIHHLHMILPGSTNNGQTSLASVVLDTLAGNNSQPDSKGDVTRVYELGNPDWSDWKTSPIDSIEFPETKVFFAGFSADELRDSSTAAVSLNGIRTERVRPSAAHESNIKAPLGAHWRDRQQAMNRGSAFHYCLAQIDWMDSCPSEGRLRNLMRTEGISNSTIAEALMDLAAARLQPKFMEIMDQSKYHDRVFRERYKPSRPLFEPLRINVKRESKVDVTIGKQHIVGTIDRLILLYEGDRLFGADIIDFKTDEISLDEVQGRAEEYRTQLLAYHRAISSSLQLKPTKVTARILFTAIDAEVAVATLS